jgi:hypothetical protein
MSNDNLENGLGPEDIQDLEWINLIISCKEDEGARDWFEDRIAPQFAIMRKDGKTFHDRATFLDKVTKRKPEEAERVTTDVKVISIPHNKVRAIVTCIVTRGDEKFHNLRMFVKIDNTWKILGWANEPLIDTQSENEPLKQ